MSTLFNIGVNGLKAQQTALNVTGQNITNASTPGYSRQRADIVSATGSLSNGVFSGSGAQVDRIQRIADDFVSNQIRIDQSLSGELESFSLNVGQLERTLYNDGAGIDAALGEFFDALQSASNNPLDAASRQFVIGKGNSLAERFDGVAQRIEQQDSDITSALKAGTVRVNELADLVAETNRRISLLQDGRDSDGLNAMIDQRDNLLKELANWVGINTSIQSDGQANVFIGKGQSLILGSQAAEIEATDNGEIFLRQAGTTVAQKVTSRLNGGELGGLIGYRDQVLSTAQNELGHIAASISYAFNEQHKLGVDLQGEFGNEFFRDLNDPNLVSQRVGIIPRENGSSSIGQVNVYIDEPLNNPASNYSLRVEANGSFAITRDSDDALVYQGANITPPTSVSFDGITVEFATGEFNPGDALQIRPYAAYATEMDVVLSDPTALALGAPVGFQASATNSGSGQLSVGAITDPQHPIFSGDQSLVPPLLVRFVSATQYEILDNSDPANPTRLDPDIGLQNYLQGSENHLLPHLEGASIVTSSGPQAGTFAQAPTWVNDLSLGTNDYPIGAISISNTASDGTTSQTSIAIPADATARDIARLLSNQSGVQATARTVMSLDNLVDQNSGVPVEIAVNGELLTGFSNLGELADAINANSVLSGQGIQASSNGQSLELVAQQGDDLTLHFQGDPSDSVTVSNAMGQSYNLNGSVTGTYQRVTLGGEVTAVLNPQTSMTAQLDGVFAANPIHQRADFGFDLLLSGNVAAGDEFAVSFSGDAAGDNRNALALGSLSSAQIIGQPGETFASKYASLVLDVGAAAGQAEVNRSAAASLLEQSESYRESVSGVNLDEEAANLIRFEQAYNASAQIISVARDTFNVLLNAI